jgi:fermentation-respiration switch protein FrsA (DUF1100 family)
MSSCP